MEETSHYELIQPGGSGLYGAVWKARDTKLDRTVAVKLVHPSMATVYNIIEHAQALVRAGGHPNIVQVFAATKIDHPQSRQPVDAVIMEWLDGELLGTRLASSGIPLHEAMEICNGVLCGVEFIHSKGLTHCDLHVNNVILTDEGPKIIDIDYSNKRSLAKLTSLARQFQIQEDVDQAAFIVLRTLKHCVDINLERLLTQEAALRLATTIDGIRSAISGIELSVPAVTARPDMASRDKKAIDDVARLKEMIENDKRISLHDLVIAEAKSLATALVGTEFTASGAFTDEELRGRVARYEELAMPLARLLAIGCYWDTPENSKLWTGAIEIPANAYADKGPQGGVVGLLNLRSYPIGILLYAAGLGATANDRYATLAHLLERIRFYDASGELKNFASAYWLLKAREKDLWNQHILGKDFYTPTSDHLFELLHQPTAEFLPQRAVFEELFDRFEYLSGMHEYQKQEWAPAGRFIWKRFGGSPVGKRLQDEFETHQANWGPLMAGVVTGGVQGAAEAFKHFEEFVSSLRRELHIW